MLASYVHSKPCTDVGSLIIACIELLDNEQEMLINVREAINHIVEAWKNVKVTAIINCWKHTDILPDTCTAEDSNVGDAENNWGKWAAAVVHNSSYT